MSEERYCDACGERVHPDEESMPLAGIGFYHRTCVELKMNVVPMSVRKVMGADLNFYPPPDNEGISYGKHWSR
jgi:hypothetical protein